METTFNKNINFLKDIFLLKNKKNNAKIFIIDESLQEEILNFTKFYEYNKIEYLKIESELLEIYKGFDIPYLKKQYLNYDINFDEIFEKFLQKLHIFKMAKLYPVENNSEKDVDLYNKKQQFTYKIVVIDEFIFFIR